MGDIVNLKRFKKRNEREQSAKQADTNRARFGRTKSERAFDEQAKDRAGHLLEQHKLQPNLQENLQDNLDDGDAS